MRIFDCTTFYDENFILDVRFNILDQFVDKFVICESAYSHSGKKKKFNFDISKFEKFKHKIIYLKIDHEPKNLIYKSSNNENTKENTKDVRINAIKRIAYQRNFLKEGIVDASNNDLIFYSDNDEIPKLNDANLDKIQNKLIFFKQKLFYYKFNLFCDRYDWHGTKGCKKKDLIDFEWLRNIKTKKYNFYRLDTLFSKTKYTDVKIINDGGWHFSQLKKIDDIYSKLTNSEDHQEFKDTGKKISDIEDLVNRKVILYDHKAKSSDFKFGKEFKLETIGLEEMPDYIKKNKDQFREWIDTTY
tara:strand:+ start:277 stop:1179 length:903 start_codon:yes stop_codon:yes gene_type:complete